MKGIVKLYLLIFIGIFITMIYLYYTLSKTELHLTKNLEHLFIVQAKDISNNIKKDFQKYMNINQLDESKQLRSDLENRLSLLVSDTFKYIYILKREKSGDYRYLLDGSREEKGEYEQLFTPSSNVWDIVYTKGKEGLIQQKVLDTLWITYLNPIVLDGETKSIIAIDISVKLPKELSLAIEPINEVLNYIFIAIAILLFLLLYQTILNFKTKKDSYTDTLTQAYNRHYLRNFLKRSNIDNYQIIMLDIDHFKRINDNYGHAMGDFVLAEVAKIIKSETRDDDVFIRFGGEEFLLFTKKSAKIYEVIDIAERIRKSIEEEIFTYDETNVKLTISCGITVNIEQFKNINEAIKYADSMLYIAKQNGRNKVVEHQNSLQKRDYIEITDVKEAIDENRLFCQYQAIFDLQTHQVVKYEALVRFKSREDKTIYPDAFLNVVMKTNIYKDITKNVLEIVFKQIKLKKVQISVNLNFSDILDDDIFALIVDEITDNSDLVSWLTIELLEYEPLENSRLMSQRLYDIRQYGVQIAIDDFGSGFANYTVFNSIPIDMIKIDGSLIKDINTSELSYSIVKSIAMLANELNIAIIAEYIENKQILEILKTLNIKQGQGFYLAKPQNTIMMNNSGDINEKKVE